MRIPTHRRFTASIAVLLLMTISCNKEGNLVSEDDARNKYVGSWNFKGNGYSYSGYYIYTGENLDPEWTYTESFSTSFNDSTGSVAIGVGEDELLITYCGTCEPVVYNLNQNGTGAWWINETEFYNDVNPGPPGYSSYYTTYNIEGWRLD